MQKTRPEDVLDEGSLSRSIWLVVYAALFVLALGTALVHLNPDARVEAQSQRQYWATIAVSSSRGKIEDRNGISLAVSVPAVSFFIDPKFWNPASADVLVPVFGAAKAKKFSQPLNGRFHWVARNLTLPKAEALAKQKVPGLYTLTEKIRVYPLGSLASHVLGYCDIDGYGQAGIELAWDHILFSPPRSRLMTRDSSGRTIDTMGGQSEVSVNTAGSLKLTLDSRIQQIMEWRLAEGAKAAGAEWAAGVCIDPSTGEIIALASYPELNQSDRSSLGDPRVIRNNVVGRVFEPGSIFKPVTMAVALEVGATTPGTTYQCKGTIKVADRIIRDNNMKAHGHETLTQVLMNSCNVGMSTMAMRVQRHQAYGLLKQFGFGEKTNVEIAGEEAGLIQSPEEWLGTVTANVFIGQGIAVTPLQAVMAIGSIANGGTLLKPYIIDEVRDNGGKLLHKGSRRVRYQVMSKNTSDFIQNAMKSVVLEGGGQAASSKRVNIAGKTGTAQVAASGQYAKGQYVASFVGFWPAEKPEYAMLISIGEPKGRRYYGGQLSAPVFKSIVEDVVQITQVKL